MKKIVVFISILLISAVAVNTASADIIRIIPGIYSDDWMVGDDWYVECYQLEGLCAIEIIGTLPGTNSVTIDPDGIAVSRDVLEYMGSTSTSNTDIHNYRIP